MPAEQTSEPRSQNPRPLRLWPGILAAVLLLLTRLGIPIVAPDQTIYAVIGGLVGGAAIIMWWLFFSRAPWAERVGALVLMVAGLLLTRLVVDVSISTGAMGGLLPLLAVPPLGVAFVAWAVVTRHLSTSVRRATMTATILIACGVWTLAKTGGFTGSFNNDLMWRWAQTPEERLLTDPAAALPLAPVAAVAAREGSVASVASPDADSSSAEALHHDSAAPGRAEALRYDNAAIDPTTSSGSWPGFRGPGRDSVIHGVRIETDWAKSPPVALWRRPIGPGWSSFAVSGNLIYTQEQRGDDELVACYDATNGKPVWVHRDAVRFWESNGGAGPRATPTLDGGRAYTFGATGILNALDARTGAVIWSRNVASDTHIDVPMWGFTSSPLIIDDEVIVAAAGTLTAYDLASGKPRWVGPRHGDSYSSPQLATIDGVAQVLLLSAAGATSVAPADGALLWEYSSSDSLSVPIVQPGLTVDGNVLVSGFGGSGTHRIAISHGSDPRPEQSRGTTGWSVTERWMSTGLKPMFNDFVVHNGHAYGFDGNILVCLDLQNGERRWKGGRYGNGQLVLLADQDVLLVTSEEGELALVGATPDKFTELARLPALNSKTWNHPVVVGSLLLVRNGEEMAEFRLSLAGH